MVEYNEFQSNDYDFQTIHLSLKGTDFRLGEHALLPGEQREKTKSDNRN